MIAAIKQRPADPLTFIGEFLTKGAPKRVVILTTSSDAMGDHKTGAWSEEVRPEDPSASGRQTRAMGARCGCCPVALRVPAAYRQPCRSSPTDRPCIVHVSHLH